MSKKHVKNPEKSRVDVKKIPTNHAPATPSPLAFDWRTAESQPLSRELRTYSTVLDQLLLQKNDYVLIKGDEVVGTYSTRELAVSEAIDRFGADPVLIKRIVETEPVLEIGHVNF